MICIDHLFALANGQAVTSEFMVALLVSNDQIPLLDFDGHFCAFALVST